MSLAKAEVSTVESGHSFCDSSALNRKHAALSCSRCESLLTAYKYNVVMFLAEATEPFVSDRLPLTLYGAASYTPLHLYSQLPLPLQVGYHGNQDGDAARAGGAVVPDVSQHATVLPDQEEDLHFQVQTCSPDISCAS